MQHIEDDHLESSKHGSEINEDDAFGEDFADLGDKQGSYNPPNAIERRGRSNSSGASPKVRSKSVNPREDQKLIPIDKETM